MNPLDQFNQANAAADETIAPKLAGLVILSLLLVFVIQRSGFRFVVSAGGGIGR